MIDCADVPIVAWRLRSGGWGMLVTSDQRLHLGEVLDVRWRWVDEITSACDSPISRWSLELACFTSGYQLVIIDQDEAYGHRSERGRS